MLKQSKPLSFPSHENKNITTSFWLFFLNLQEMNASQINLNTTMLVLPSIFFLIAEI